MQTTNQDPATIEIKYGPKAGKYTVHTAARLFPLMIGERFEELKSAIADVGQQQPIVVDGNMLLDGRNRVNALNELEREPLIVEYKDLNTGVPAAAWVRVQNLERRHLTNDQYLAIVAKFRDDRKKATSTNSFSVNNAQDTDEKTAVTKDSRPTLEFPQEPAEKVNRSRRGRKPGARSDAVALARESNQSRYRAEQIIKVRDKAPELAVAVEEGRINLKDAVGSLSTATLADDNHEQPSSKVMRAENIFNTAEKLLKEHAGRLNKDQRIGFWEKTTKLCERELDLLRLGRRK